MHSHERFLVITVIINMSITDINNNSNPITVLLSPLSPFYNPLTPKHVT